MIYRIGLFVLLFFCALSAGAHGVDDATQAYLQTQQQTDAGVFMYIGAKHMFTGYDHLLFLLGVLFFVFKARDVLLYISMFTLGHSLTLMTGVLAQVSLNPYLIDAIIGLSVVYKGFDNLGGFERMGIRLNGKLMVLVFGLFHGFGLATKLQAFELPQEGLLTKLVSFNLGVELGQILALMFILLFINAWRRHASFERFAWVTNTALMSAGFMLTGMQMTGYFVN